MRVDDLMDELKRQPPHVVVLIGSESTPYAYPNLDVRFDGNCVRIENESGDRDDIHEEEDIVDDEAHDEIVEQCAKAIDAIEGGGPMSKTARKQCAEVVRALKVGG